MEEPKKISQFSSATTFTVDDFIAIIQQVSLGVYENKKLSLSVLSNVLKVILFDDFNTVEPIVVNTGNFTLPANYASKGVRVNYATNVTLTINKFSAVPIPVGRIVSIEQMGNGVVTVAGIDGDVTIVGPNKTKEQGHVIQIWHVSTNNWKVIAGVS
jgi:hypothetical protein